MSTSVQLADGDPQLLAAVERSRKLLHRRALTAGAASAVPVPGVDWVLDVTLMSKLIPAINAEFGLTPEQIALLPSSKRRQVEKAAGLLGALMVGRFVTRDLVIRAAKAAGKRLVLKQVTKFVPFAGSAVSAALGYSAIRSLGEKHIRDCVEVCLQAHLTAPAAPELPAESAAG